MLFISTCNRWFRLDLLELLRRARRARPTWFLFAALGFLPSFAGYAAPALMEFDLTRPTDAGVWQSGAHDSRFQVTPEGLEVTITGEDPYFYGPRLTAPTNQPLRLLVRLRSEAGGMGQVFAQSPATGHDMLADFTVPRGQWKEVRVDLPPLTPAHRLRLDPPGTTGKCVIASLRLEARRELPPPQWPAWIKPPPATGASFSTEVLQLLSHPRNAHAFELRVLGKPMAFANLVPRIAYLRGEEVRWTEVTGGQAHTEDGALVANSQWTDAEGAEWRFRSQFRPVRDRVEVTVEVRVNRDREVLYLPLLQLFVGEGSFGSQKKQALLAGLEYLDNEPSSSELDIIGPGAKRQVPAAHQLTFPLMAVQAEGRYVALAWEDTRKWSALFDSPDRLFGSGGHVMGVIWPETDVENRSPGNLFAKYPKILKADQPLRFNAWLLAGAGDSVVPAVQQYVRLRGLPALPDPGYSLENYAALMAQGWLKSKIRVGNRYRHAWAGEHFGPGPAADAAVFETWLAPLVRDGELAQALRTTAAAALAEVGPNGLYHSGVGHVHTPVAPLIFGNVSAAIEAARGSARASLAAFDASGRIIYRPSASGLDFGKGHWEPDANGLTAAALIRTLEGAAFSGDKVLIAQSVALLIKLDKFHGTAPRGAQTWEIPLHTPDILASAYLVRAYVTGYELTGAQHFLDEAAYWAWTGVPFVYLVNPTGQSVGPYATIPVLGATHWKAPNWMGLPVQWCGMVYADALYRLTAHDTSGPWRQLADGITISGIQQTYPPGELDRGGLLPDSFVLQAQHRNPADINPATVGIGAARLYTRNPLYDFRALPEQSRAEQSRAREQASHATPEHRLLIHAPGRIQILRQDPGIARFRVDGWAKQPYFILINGLTMPPQVKVNQQPVVLAAPNEFLAPGGHLILQLSGAADVELSL
jgi:hypothetical protein